MHGFLVPAPANALAVKKTNNASNKDIQKRNSRKNNDTVDVYDNAALGILFLFLIQSKEKEKKKRS